MTTSSVIDSAVPDESIQRQIAFKDLIVNNSTENKTTAAQVLLRPIIKYWVVELMDCGGTTPDATCEWVCEEEPELCEVLGKDHVLALCEEIHQSGESVHSEWYQVRFRQFNKEFFDGRLPHFCVRVVYDVPLWMNGEGNGLERSAIAGDQILLAITRTGNRFMECGLIHHMAHLSTETSSDDDVRWIQEMKRLRSLGAPIVNEDLDDQQ